QNGGVSLKDSLLMRNHITLDVNAFKLVSNYSDKNKSSGCLPDFPAISRSAGRPACNLISSARQGVRRIAAGALVLLQAALRQTFYECHRFARLIHAASPAARHQAPFPSLSP